MCMPTTNEGMKQSKASTSAAVKNMVDMKKSTEEKSKTLTVPSLGARYTCASILVGLMAVWGKFTFVDEATIVGKPMHSYKVPLFFTVFYLISLPLLRSFTTKFLSNVDVKILLKESMIIYNGAQVLLNGWMVYRCVHAILFEGQAFVGDLHSTATTFAVWVHYCDKYLEFFDTYFMVLRGRMDQVSFLHVYHHTSIAWCWWIGISIWPGGDAYFGALLNSMIHVMMYSYYTLSLCKVACPWKAHLTKAQLAQFTSVIIYTGFSFFKISKRNDTTWKHYLCHATQVFEMVSMFVLFMHFYRKKYSSKKKSKENTAIASSEGQKMKKIQSTASIASTADTVVSSASIEEVSQS